MRGPVGAVVLAAGASTRLGTPKQLIRFRGRTLLTRTVYVAAAAGFQPIVVVVGAYGERIRQEVALPPGAGWVENPRWPEGMSTSIRVGLAALVEAVPSVRGVLMMACDQPYVSVTLLRRMAAAYRRTGAPVVACMYGGTFGVPALFDGALFPELLVLEGDTGAKSVIARHLDRAVQVPFPRGVIDIDMASDRAKLLRHSTIRETAS
ncbi:MAG: nucleotidyltransferase family protein [Acidobacteria bacterium]|nr:nucleotidyltransferase family protein [Acidobacteriota bacterium]MDW7984906.1 nucleotidyltransferase family protein [Acidobacteriota bacterium]